MFCFTSRTALVVMTIIDVTLFHQVFYFGYANMPFLALINVDIMVIKTSYCDCLT